MPRGIVYVDIQNGETNNIAVVLAHYVSAGDNGCWEWTGSVNNNGYGKVTVDYRTLVAHRYFYEQLRGKVAPGLQLDHLCRNRLCVNPEHLEPVSCKENVRRGNGFGGVNSRKTHCIHGHEFTEENTYRWAKEMNKRKCKECQKQRDKRARA